MSTQYMFGKPIPVSELHRLEKYGIKQWQPKEDDKSPEAEQFRNGTSIIFLTDAKDGEKNFIHSEVSQGEIYEATRYGGNDPVPLLTAIRLEFRVVTVSEEDEEGYNAPWMRQWQYFGEQGEKCPCCGKPK